MMMEEEDKEKDKDALPKRKGTNSSGSNSVNRSSLSSISLSKYSDEVLKELKMVKENKKCFDCGGSPCNWACVRNGIFLCAKCSSVHRLYPSETSDILSIILDEWSEEELNQMKNGGNKRLKDFLEENDISMEETPINTLYNLTIMNYYRLDLKSENDNSKSGTVMPLPMDYMEMY